MHTEKARGEPKKRTKCGGRRNIGYYHCRRRITSLKFKAKGDFLHGAHQRFRKTPSYSRLGKNFVNKVPLSGVATRFVEECEKKSQTSGILQQNGQNDRCPDALSYAQLGSCSDFIEANMDSARKKEWELRKNRNWIKRTCVQECEKIRQPNKTDREKAVESLSHGNYENREFNVDSGASLQMMSKNELTSGEKETIRRSKEPTVITTARGAAESTEEATVYVNNLDVFVTMMHLKDSLAVLSLGSLCESTELLLDGKVIDKVQV